MTTKALKRDKLERAGWKAGGVDEFLALSHEEHAYIGMKLALGDALRKKRIDRHVSQVDLAGLLASSQSRVAKMETGDASVSLDLLVRALFALGASRQDVVQSIALAGSRRASSGVAV